MAVIINGTNGIADVNGTAAAPAITGADSDTGVYFGTNLLGLATNGTNALYVDSSQNVGIGTTSPSSYGKLAVSGVVGISNAGALGYAWRYFRNTSTPTAYCYDDGTNVQLTVQTAGALQLGTNDTERMRITSTGGVNVGTYSADPGAGNMSVTGTVAMGSSFLRNRIINGAMVIDQRNAGASVTASTTGAYALDRWYLEEATDGAATVQQVSDGPTGFTNSLKVTVTSTDTSIGATQYFEVDQNIEGFNTADLGFGTASASTITISFWVKSSLTGAFGGSIRNSAANRSYPFSYTISVANTWEQKTVTIAGDTTGTWIGATNGIGLRLTFALAAGSSLSGTANTWAGANYLAVTGSTNLMGTASATWQITGVQLEVGSTATPFERRLYGQELALCQRYYYKVKPNGGAAQPTISLIGTNNSTTTAVLFNQFPVTMRTTPTAIENSGTAGDYLIRSNAVTTTCNTTPLYSDNTGPDIAVYTITVASGLTAGYPCYLRANANTGYVAWSAEL